MESVEVVVWIGQRDLPIYHPAASSCGYEIYKKRHPGINSLREELIVECASITDR